MHNIISKAIELYGPSASLVARRTRIPQSLCLEYITSDPLCATVYKVKSDILIGLIREHRGDLSAVADSAGMSRNALETVTLDNDEVAEEISNWTLRITDSAESQLRAAIDSGRQWAIELELTKTRRGAARGYGSQENVLRSTDVPPERLASIRSELARRLAGQNLLGSQDGGGVIEGFTTNNDIALGVESPAVVGE